MSPWCHLNGRGVAEAPHPAGDRLGAGPETPWHDWPTGAQATRVTGEAEEHQ